MGKQTDVKLENDLVRITGWQLFLDGADLIIDAGDYGDPERKMGQSGQRRAIAHGRGDKLILNYSGDYTGGTIIQARKDADGTVHGTIIEGNLTTQKINADELLCTGETKATKLSAYDIVHLIRLQTPYGTTEISRNLPDLISALSTKIDDLEVRVKALEGRT